MKSAQIVANAATMMDEMYPGWFDLIDTDTLNITDGCNCITGQLNGKEVATENWERLNEVVLGPMGSHTRNSASLWPFSSSSATEFWVKEIEARRGAPIEIKHEVKEAELIPA